MRLKERQRAILKSINSDSSIASMWRIHLLQVMIGKKPDIILTSKYGPKIIEALFIKEWDRLNG